MEIKEEVVSLEMGEIWKESGKETHLSQFVSRCWFLCVCVVHSFPSPLVIPVMLM